MGGFLSAGTGDTNAGTPTTYTGIQIQTSAAGVSIPIGWGRFRGGTNIIWAGPLVETPLSKKGGKGGGKGVGQYTYSIPCILALCEGSPQDGAFGPGIMGISTVWQGKKLVTLADLGFTLFTGTASQPPWSFLTANFPGQAVPYAYTAYLANPNYSLGPTPDLPNHEFEIWTPASVAYGCCGYGVDINPAYLIPDFLTNPQYSIGIPASAIDATSLAQYLAYCAAQWLLFSPNLTTQEQCSQTLDRWAKLTNSWIFWSGSKLKFVPLGDSTINPSTMGTVTDVILTAVPLARQYNQLREFLLLHSDAQLERRRGRRVPVERRCAHLSRSVESSSDHRAGAVRDLCPAGVALVYVLSPKDAGTPIIVTYNRTYNDVLSYVPNLTIVANLTYDDFITGGKGQGSNAPPVEVTRLDPADCANHVRLQIKDRNNAYNDAVSEWKDQGLATKYGLIDSPVSQADEIVDPIVGAIAAQLVGQRGAYIRNSYAFTLGWEWGSVFEPGDLVTISEPHINLANFPVRLKTLDEDEYGNWKVVAEEFPGGVTVDSSGKPTGANGGTIGTVGVPLSGGGVQATGGSTGGTQTPQGTQNNPINTNVNPGSVNPPCIWEPPAALTCGCAQMWFALSGGPNWGGAAVYISFDNDEFYCIGSVIKGSPQGLLTAGIGAGGINPDTADTLSVDFTESGLLPGTDATTADAVNERTLSLLTPAFTTAIPNSGEAIAYGAAAATGTWTENFTYLYRGLNGTTRQAFSTGAFFTRLEQQATQQYFPVANAILAWDTPQYVVGQTLYFKFPSINRFGAAAQTLADCTTYTYVPNGAGFVAVPIRYDIDSWLYGTQSVASQLMRRFTADRTTNIGTTQHVINCDTAPTNDLTITIMRNGVTVGTATIPATEKVGTVTISGAFTMSSGDVLEHWLPATPDPTAANINLILAGLA